MVQSVRWVQPVEIQHTKSNLDLVFNWCIVTLYIILFVKFATFFVNCLYVNKAAHGLTWVYCTVQCRQNMNWKTRLMSYINITDSKMSEYNYKTTEKDINGMQNYQENWIKHTYTERDKQNQRCRMTTEKQSQTRKDDKEMEDECDRCSNYSRRPVKQINSLFNFLFQCIN